MFTGWCHPLSGVPLNYDPSRVYSYIYSTDVRFNEPALEGSTSGSDAKHDVGFRVSGKVQMSPVWYHANQLLIGLSVCFSQIFLLQSNLFFFSFLPPRRPRSSDGVLSSRCPSVRRPHFQLSLTAKVSGAFILYCMVLVPSKGTSRF